MKEITISLKVNGETGELLINSKVDNELTDLSTLYNSYRGNTTVDPFNLALLGYGLAAYNGALVGINNLYEDINKTLEGAKTDENTSSNS